jgi:ABC-type Fe3+ transport system permease subunit
MSLIEIPWNPPPRQLRQFGVCGLIALPLLGWIIVHRANSTHGQTFQWMVFSGFVSAGIVMGIFAWLMPRALKPLFLGLSLITLPIGLVISELAMLILYFVVLTPMALIFRLTGRDALQRRYDRAADSYWAPRNEPYQPERYFRQS